MGINGKYFMPICFYLILILFLSCSDQKNENNEDKDVYFSKVFGEYDAEMGYSIHPTSDGGYIISGATSSYWATDSLPRRVALPAHGVTDAIIAKIDRYGDPEWIKTYGGEQYESAFNAKQTNDGGYFFTGYNSSTGAGLYDFWLVKLNNQGTIAWQKTYGTANADIGFYGDITSDNGFILTGYTVPENRMDKDIWLIKTDGEGNELWSHTFGDNLSQSGTFLQETDDSGFIVIGETTGSSTQTDIILLKTDHNGIEEWRRVISEPGSDVPYAIKQTNNGYIMVATTTSMGAGNKDILLISFDLDGNIMWQKTYGGPALEYGFDVILDDDGYVLTGSTSSYGTMFYDMWIIKVDLGGEIIWDEIYSGNNIDIGRAIINNQSGGFTVLGQTSSYGAGEFDFWVLKMDNNGIVPDQ